MDQGCRSTSDTNGLSWRQESLKLSGNQKKRVRTPTKGWHQVASGDIGDMLYWEPGYDVLSEGESAIGTLENMDWSDIDWNHLIQRLPRFEFLPALLRERSFSFLAWGEVDGFYALEGDNQEETGSMSSEWTRMWLEMDHNKKRRIFHDFEVLTNRLYQYPPLARFW